MSMVEVFVFKQGSKWYRTMADSSCPKCLGVGFSGKYPKPNDGRYKTGELKWCSCSMDVEYPGPVKLKDLSPAGAEAERRATKVTAK